MSWKVSGWVAVLCVAISSLCHAIPGYRMVDLARISDGAEAVSINDVGQILGWAGDVRFDPPLQQRSVRWNSPESAPVDLGSWSPQAINSSGQAVGWEYDASGRQHACRWDSFSGLQDLGLLADGLSGDSYAFAINSGGTVVGTSATGGADFPDRQPCYWDAEGHIHGLANLSGETWGFANAINDAGTIVGESGGRACKWNSGGVTALSLPDNDWSSARGINGAGTILGEYHDPATDAYHACVWDSGGFRDLGTWMANVINDGGVAAGFFYDSEGRSHACVSDQNGALVELPDLDGASEALGINSDGWIVGYSISLTQNNYHAVLWQPVPEPSGLAGPLGGVALVAVTRLRRWRRRVRGFIVGGKWSLILREPQDGEWRDCDFGFVPTVTGSSSSRCEGS